MASRTVDHPVGPISYRESGPPDGPVVVFVHWFLVGDTLWADVPDRLAERGFRCLAPTWSLGSHRTPTVGRLVLTNCDAFDTFPPLTLDVLFRLARREAVGPRTAAADLVGDRVRTGALGFGLLTRRRLTAEETEPWVTPYLAEADVRRDVAIFARAWTGRELADSARWLGRIDRPCSWCGAAGPFFKLALARRLTATFPDARLVEVDAARFVALDQPVRLADEIAAFASG
jgi:pimeloyl-ACP methyl ester carboxylesterase